MSAYTEEGRAEEEREYAIALEAAADYLEQFLRPGLVHTPMQIAETIIQMKPLLCPWDCDHCRE